MIFSSATFLIIFLPVTMVLYYLLGVTITKSTAVKNLILLIASLGRAGLYYLNADKHLF